MPQTALRLATFRYEHTEALFDGTVSIDGVDATLETAPIVTDIFRRMVHDRDLDVAELGLTYYLRTLDQTNPPFLALPIFPNRNFRHSAIFVNTASGIRTPRDLIGRTIGEFALYGHDAGVWPKGILADEWGVSPEQCRWVIGGTNAPLPALDWIPQPVPAGVDVRHAEDGQTLGAMLEDGSIDALISVDVPDAILAGSPRVARLFPDYEQVERDYYRRTGIFPPMHIVAMRRELAVEPGPARAVVPSVPSRQGAKGQCLPLRRDQAARLGHDPLVQQAVRREPATDVGRLVALRRQRQPHRCRHLPALPPRAGTLPSPLACRGRLRSRTARHVTGHDDRRGRART